MIHVNIEEKENKRRERGRKIEKNEREEKRREEKERKRKRKRKKKKEKEKKKKKKKKKKNTSSTATQIRQPLFRDMKFNCYVPRAQHDEGKYRWLKSHKQETHNINTVTQDIWQLLALEDVDDQRQNISSEECCCFESKGL